mgnify:CR=1 FL=1
MDYKENLLKVQTGNHLPKKEPVMNLQKVFSGIKTRAVAFRQLSNGDSAVFSAVQTPRSGSIFGSSTP